MRMAISRYSKVSKYPNFNISKYLCVLIINWEVSFLKWLVFYPQLFLDRKKSVLIIVYKVMGKNSHYNSNSLRELLFILFIILGRPAESLVVKS